MILVHIALIVVVMGPVQLIGWVAPSCICTDIVLDGIINKLQYSIFCIKRSLNRVFSCAKTSILSLK